VIDSYKHSWMTCNDCGTLIRERKKRYVFDNWFFRPIISNTPLQRVFGKTLLSMKEVAEDEKKFYDYYYESAKKGIKGTKWEKANEKVLGNLERYGISPNNKSCLDISGGPGFLTKQLASVAKNAIVTEFSQYAVDGMRSALNVEAVKFDYNSENVDQCLKGKYDIIFVIYSIGFCNDIRGFAQSLKKLMHEGCYVYLCYSPPTLGLMMRWQFDEYTYTRGWEPDTLIRVFTDIGMKLIAREDEGSYSFDKDWFNSGKNAVSKLLRKTHRVIGKYYLNKALRRKDIMNRELVQKNERYLFKLEASNG
jgi:hypothetical protein